MKPLFREIERRFGITPRSATPLEGYEDRTYLLESARGRWVLKEHTARPGLGTRLDLEARMMEHFREGSGFAFPNQLRSGSGETHFMFDGKSYRILEYLEGAFMAESQQDGPLLESLGRLLGEMANLSASFGPVATSPEPSAWDLQHLGLSLPYIQEIADINLQSRVAYMVQQYEAEVTPKAYRLRRGLIHNDANDWNILVRDGRVTGLIDFGDACHSWLAADLAVGLTYALMAAEAPLQAAEPILRSYCSVFPLEELEADLLYYLIGGRLCMSLCQAAHAAKIRPDSGYITISQEPAQRLLRKWIRLGPRAASRAFRRAAGLEVTASPTAEAYQKRRSGLLSPSLSLSYDTPIVMERAAFQYMFAGDGTTYLDAYNNIIQVGHCHPEVVGRTRDALRKLNTNTRYHYDSLLDYAETLLGYFPPPLSRVFLVNSGSAATDLALRLARAFTGRQRVVALEHGYHGNTAAAIAVSPYKHRPGDKHPQTTICPMPKVFGSGWADDGTAGRQFSGPCLDRIRDEAEAPAAFIAEPIMGCGGQVPLPKGYLEAIYPAIRARGGLCISDEVQVGFGRLGNSFLGFQKYGVVPDLVILGKPMGNGHPLGAVVCTPEIADAFANGPEFFSSFGGNPVSCAAGKAVLDVIRHEGLQAHAAKTGNYLMEGLRSLGKLYPTLADVRGEGLFVGAELVDGEGNPATSLAARVKNALKEKRVLVGTDGPHDNVLKIKPPLPFDTGNCDELIEKLGAILAIQNNSK
ncbi:MULTISPECIES: aminotransferase class III-fold pyridoxal phosphate-dependent enzyme [unclassified Robiginitalea]|uniref:aminotransferase class III-fold pyridoxal phosphate-dependent enzyme n=1 Tax=Robiginitalea TaxID=252306 RepID=UPI00234B1197|nr:MULTISPECIES: aminotransferase class III-fold pyridoxal phosphate-dependent enzyme [unclassified Robiginitalea]MDC6353983.1 aminotransferase class III-fold pyridoxal phosphate-dependent enzyme [Robiginitalea sp. PM2]MDC6374250.1 aminotransferase class III-fold pyridoxal phosphate-dependent enzyme [Robiginitalea sp. SP8]